MEIPLLGVLYKQLVYNKNQGVSQNLTYIFFIGIQRSLKIRIFNSEIKLWHQMSALLQSVTQTSNEWFSSCSMTALAGLSAPRHKSNLINCKSNNISLIVPSGWCLNSPFSLYIIVPAAPFDFLQGSWHERGRRKKQTWGRWTRGNNSSVFKCGYF